MTLAHQAFRRKGVPAAWLQRLALRELTATDLDGDRTVELAVYGQQAGRWSAVYSGGGGGC